jgi:hypothetical protein
VSLERDGVSPEGCWGRLFWWAAEAGRSVGSCRWVVIVSGVFYDLCGRLCFVVCERKWVFPQFFRGPLWLSPTDSGIDLQNLR